METVVRLKRLVGRLVMTHLRIVVLKAMQLCPKKMNAAPMSNLVSTIVAVTLLVMIHPSNVAPVTIKL